MYARIGKRGAIEGKAVAPLRAPPLAGLLPSLVREHLRFSDDVVWAVLSGPSLPPVVPPCQRCEKAVLALRVAAFFAVPRAKPRRAARGFVGIR